MKNELPGELPAVYMDNMRDQWPDILQKILTNEGSYQPVVLIKSEDKSEVGRFFMKVYSENDDRFLQFQEFSSDVLRMIFFSRFINRNPETVNETAFRLRIRHGDINASDISLSG